MVKKLIHLMTKVLVLLLPIVNQPRTTLASVTRFRTGNGVRSRDLGGAPPETARPGVARGGAAPS
jgi:hypothetical protein